MSQVFLVLFFFFVIRRLFLGRFIFALRPIDTYYKPLSQILQITFKFVIFLNYQLLLFLCGLELQRVHFVLVNFFQDLYLVGSPSKHKIFRADVWKNFKVKSNLKQKFSTNAFRMFFPFTKITGARSF